MRPRDELEITWTLEGEPIARALGAEPVARLRGGGHRRGLGGPTRGDAARRARRGGERRGAGARCSSRSRRWANRRSSCSSWWRSSPRTSTSPPTRVAATASACSSRSATPATQFVDYGQVLVAQYVSDGQRAHRRRLRADGRPVAAYYDLDGRSLRKSFLKSPLEFTRITSGFTYARPHPILGGVRPHLAVDYAAPVGTPVRAVADGTVLRRRLERRQRHPGAPASPLRLRDDVQPPLEARRPGSARARAVTQRQVIGYVGSTGRQHRSAPRLPRGEERPLREPAQREVHPRPAPRRRRARPLPAQRP